MKKIFLLAVVLLSTAFHASAEYKSYYVVEEVGMEYPSFWRFMIDWDAKLFFLESDSERENNGRILKYKEDGNKRTFEVWSSAEGGENLKIYSATFTTDGEGKYTLALVVNPEYKPVFKLSDVEPNKEGSGDDGKPASLKDKINAKTNSVKDAIGKGVNKGLDALKKKK